MRLKELLEDRTENPLGKMPADAYQVMEIFDEIENDFAQALLPDDTRPYPEKVKEIRQAIRDLGQIKSVPISKLNTMEPDIDMEHAKALAAGNPNKNGPAIVYFFDNEYYINDGNHRVVAQFLQGKESAEVLVIDTDTIVRKTDQLLGY